MQKFKAGLLCLMMAASPLALYPEFSFANSRTPVSIEEGSPLPLRILTRPNAKLYKEASETDLVEGQLPVFKPYFVYSRPGGESRETGLGWYEVGTDEKGTVVGWMKTSDVFEWKQTMCLAYSHPEGRKPVLMFEDDYELDQLLKEMPDSRVGAVEKIYADIDNAANTPLPKDFPVISVEPKLAVDITKQFYLLPILEHETIQMESYEGRKLLLAAVTAKEEAEEKASSDIRQNTEYAAAAVATEENHKKSNEELLFDIVWVMDTTRSMQPYIEEVRNILEASSQDLGKSEELSKRLAFGIWAYRDSESIKDIGYLTKNFTPELQDLPNFLTTIKGVTETKTDSVDVNEDLFAGVHDAITKTAWRPNAQRFIIIVGDAPSHELGHKWNSSQLDEKTLRTLATENKVTVLGIHVRPNINKRYNNMAQRQFEPLTTNPGTNAGLLWSLSSSNRENFVADTKFLTQSLAANLEGRLEAANLIAAEEKVVVVEEVKVDNSGKAADDVRPSDEQLQQALKAASVTWLGSTAEVKPPSDIEAWVTDKDLLDPSIQSLDIRLLISKRQLDTLAGMLNEIIMAGTESQMTSEDFFSSLQSVSATASRNADQLANAQTLQDSGMVPAFLEGLPYESQIMSMSTDLWASLGPDEQDQFIEALRSKVAAYQSLNETPDQWIPLNQGDAADDFVTPIPLELLP